MKRKLICLLLTIGLFVAWSCEKETIDQTENQIDNETFTTQKEVNSFDNVTIKNYRGELARMLSVVCAENPDFIEVLKQSTTETKRSTGYYESEFFFNLVKDKKRTALQNLSFRELLINRFDNAREILDYMGEHDPGLAVLLVDKPNKNVNQVKFYVNNNDFDDNDEASIVAYYKNGELGHQTIGEGADNLSFVVRQSEAYYSHQRLALSFNRGIKKGIESNKSNFIKMSDKGYIVLTRGQSTDVDGSNNTGGADPRTDDCERDLVDGTEHFYRFRARNNFDSFLNGFDGGEFRFHIMFYDGEIPTFNGQQLIAEGGPDPFIVENVPDNNQWIYTDFPIATWDTSTFGDRILVVAFEDDGSLFELDVTIDQEVEFTIPGTNTTVTADVQFRFAIGLTDDEIGQQFVEYCQPTFNDALPENETYKLGNDVDFHQIEHDGGLQGCLFQFFEGNGGGQDLLGTVGSCQSQIFNLAQGHPLAPNDEIRSMKIIEAPAGTVIRVFDDSKGFNGDDDFAIITVLQDIFGGNEVTINSFEEPINNNNFYQLEYCCGGNLDGKISRVEIN